VLDIAAHLIFNFTLPVNLSDPTTQLGCFPIFKPDLPAFQQIVAELAALRTNLASGQFGGHNIVTSGLPLGIHPGLADPAAEASVALQMKTFLQAHLTPQRLAGMAVAALPSGASRPWIFLSMLELPNGDFAPLHGPTLDGQQFSQLLNAASVNPRVVPAPHTNNRNPITCVNAALFQNAGPPVGDRHGSSTSDLFSAQPASAVATAQDVLNLVADPSRSHFFNTDCVSCHTETTASKSLNAPVDLSAINPAVLPTGVWVVRNFGWSDEPRAVVTRRTAAETADVVNFINASLH
jgi:mono/diheme cytochrome c family protein